MFSSFYVLFIYLLFYNGAARKFENMNGSYLRLDYISVGGAVGGPPSSICGASVSPASAASHSTFKAGRCRLPAVASGPAPRVGAALPSSPGHEASPGTALCCPKPLDSHSRISVLVKHRRLPAGLVSNEFFQIRAREQI